LILQNASLDKGELGSTPVGPPKKVNAGVKVDKSQALSKHDLEQTVAHELGHGVSIVHHGYHYLHVQFVTHDPDITQPVFADKRFNENFGHYEYRDEANHLRRYPYTVKVPKSVKKLCGFKVPGPVNFGEKGDDYSGREDCLMRYNDPVAYQEMPYGPGEVTCTKKVSSQRQFCKSDRGVTFNKNNKAAGRASKGRCRGQIKVRDY
jgi:hypothetical protein